MCRTCPHRSFVPTATTQARTWQRRLSQRRGAATTGPSTLCQAAPLPMLAGRGCACVHRRRRARNTTMARHRGAVNVPRGRRRSRAASRLSQTVGARQANISWPIWPYLLGAWATVKHVPRGRRRTGSASCFSQTACARQAHFSWPIWPRGRPISRGQSGLFLPWWATVKHVPRGRTPLPAALAQQVRACQTLLCLTRACSSSGYARPRCAVGV